MLLALNELTKAGGWNLETRGRLKGLGEHDAKGLGFSDELLAGLFGTTREGGRRGRTEEPEKIWGRKGSSSSSGSIGSTSATRSPRKRARSSSAW